MPIRFSFFVPGIPAPGGSKRFVGFGKKSGRAILIDDAGERNKNWRSSVAHFGLQARTSEAKTLGVSDLLTVPLLVTMEFVMPRPKGHFNAKGVVRGVAPKFPTTRPDVLKLARSTEDALTGVIWADDAQTVTLHLSKRFADLSESSGAQITVTALE